MSTCLLSDRAIIAVSGADAEALLNRLFTNSVLGMATGEARYAALLSPQGKLLHDFFVFKRDNAFWLDCRRDQAAELAKKLTMFRLRAKVVIENRSGEIAIAAAWGSALLESPGPTFRDPRHNELGYRIVAPDHALALFDNDRTTYDAHRINLGVPEGGVDWIYGDAFVHDANMDLLHGVDFGKGCYVGQEVVSRVHHRNSARKRIVRLHFFGDPPPASAALTAGSTQIGQVTSVAAGVGLAMARIDRLAEAEASSAPVLAGETLVGVSLPAASLVVAPTYADDDAIF